MARRHKDNAGARLSGDVNDYASAMRFLGNRDERKIANNTYIVRLPPEIQFQSPQQFPGVDLVGARLHNTVIITWFPHGAPMLNSGGYSTVTTKARMNAFLEGTPWSVSQKRGEWFVHNRHQGTTNEFYDGVRLSLPNPGRPSSRGRAPGKRPSSRHSYGVPIKGYSVGKHTRRRPLEYARNPGVTTVAEIQAALDHGPYAWPGGYPLFFITADGGALSFDSVKEEWDNVREAVETDDDGSGWRVVAVEVNWEDENLYDDHSGAKIPSAYGDGDE